MLRRRLIGRMLLLLLMSQILTEFVDSSVLHALGFTYGGLGIHLIKVVAGVIIVIPILTFWLKDYSNLRMNVAYQSTMDRKLAEVHALIDSFTAHTTDAFMVVDPSGVVVQVNPAWEQMFGRRRETWVGDDLAQIPYMRLLQSVIEGRCALETDLTIGTGSGAPVPVSMSAAPIFLPDGQLFGVSCRLKDMSDHFAAAEIARRSEKVAVAGELAAGIAHEIRNPLTAIRGFLQLMKESASPQYLDILLTEVDRIDRMTHELLMVSKPQAGQMEGVDIASIINDVLTLLQGHSALQGVSIHNDISMDELPLVRGVNDQLKQVFINLVKNAIEAQVDGGYVRVSAQVNEECVTVEVLDGGPGMAPQTLSRLGEPFYTTKARGTGLGLMTTYRIVENHSGQIKVDSELGKGSRFVVELPRASTRLATDSFPNDTAPKSASCI